MQKSIYNMFDTMYPSKKNQNIIKVLKDESEVKLTVDNLVIHVKEEKTLTIEKRKGSLNIAFKDIKRIYLKKIAGIKYYDSDFYEMNIEYVLGGEMMKEVISLNSVNYFTPVDEVEKFLNCFLTFQEMISKNINTVETRYTDLVEVGDVKIADDSTYEDIKDIPYEEEFYAKKSNDRIIAGMKKDGKIFNLQDSILKSEIKAYQQEAKRNNLEEYFFTSSQASCSNYVDVWAEKDKYAIYIKNLKKTPLTYYFYISLIFIGSLFFAGCLVYVISHMIGF